MSDNKATDIVSKSHTIVQLATAMDAESSSVKNIQKKKRNNKLKKPQNNGAKLFMPTSVELFTVKTCTDSAQMV